jgi:hypothetical protein
MTQLQARLVKLRLRSADRATQISCNLAVRQPFHVVQQEDGPVASRQLPESTRDGDPIDGSGQLLIFHRKQIQKRSFSGMLAARPQFNRYGAMTVGAQAHEHHIDGQPV